jgi:hypothetical protein
MNQQTHLIRRRFGLLGAIGYTQRRFLPAGAEATLRLPTAATITTVRQAEGLLEVMSMPTSPMEIK